MKQKTNNEYVLIEYSEHKVDVDTTTSYLSYDLIEKTNLIRKIFQDSEWLQYKELVKNFKSKQTEDENINRILSFKKYRGGDRCKVPYDTTSLFEMIFMVKQIEDCHFPQPEIFPWAGGGGLQAEWTFPIYEDYYKEFYMEIGIGPTLDYSIWICDPYYELDIEIKDAPILYRIMKTIFSLLLE